MNKQQYQDFQERLTSHHRGSVENQYTADPIYLVQKRVIDWGYVEEYAQHHQLYGSCDEVEYDTVEEFFEDWEDECVEGLLKNTGYSVDIIKDQPTLEGLDTLESILNEHEDYKYDGYQLQHGNERYETVHIFLTHKAAEDFLKAKGWKEGDEGGRIYVDSLCRSREFREVIDLIVSGKLEFKEVL